MKFIDFIDNEKKLARDYRVKKNGEEMQRILPTTIFFYFFKFFFYLVGRTGEPPGQTVGSTNGRK